jgi:tetratricopeptide (TPR) repeat protein
MKKIFEKIKPFIQLSLKYLQTAVKKMTAPKTTTEGSQTQKTRWEQLQASFSVSTKVFLAGLFIIILVHSIHELFRYQLVIQPIETPFDLSRQGYTGTVVAYRLQDYMGKIREDMQRSSMEEIGIGIAAVQLTELQKRPEIDVPTVGLSLNATIAQLRRILRIEPRRVTGDIVVTGDQLHLSLRITGKPLFETSSDDVKNPESLIHEAAKHLLKTFEPLVLGLNYCLNNKTKELETLIKDIQTNQPSKKDKAVAFLLEGCLFKRQGQYEKALNQLAKAQQLDSKNPVIFQMKGDIWLDKGKAEPAIVEYKQALSLNAYNAGIYTQWARALIATGNTEAAFAKYQQASEMTPNNPWIYTSWGEQLAEQGQLESAIKKFEQAQTIQPNYALAYALWGNVLLKQGQYAQAAAKYQSAVKFDNNIAWFYGNWAAALTKQGKYQEALAQYEAADKLEHNLAWIYSGWGDTLAKLKGFEQAIAKYKKAVALAPKNADYYYLWGHTLFNLTRYEEALVQYQQATTLASKPERRYYYWWGKALSRLGQYENAIIQFEKALEIEPNHVWSHNHLGYAVAQNQQPEKALEQCKIVLALKEVQKNTKSAQEKSGSANAVCGLALIAQNKSQAAIEKCQTAITLHPQSGWAAQCLETALLRLEKTEDFVKYESFVEELTNDSLKARYYYTYARALSGLKRYQTALPQYQKANDFGLANASFYGDWGNALLNAENPTDAIVKYQLAIAKNANLNWIYGGWGMALAQLKQYEPAIIQYKKALELGATWVYSELAKALIQLGPYDEPAIKALGLEPTYKLYYELGKVLTTQRQYEKAITQYQKALALKPDYVWGQIRLAHALTRVNQFGIALTHCEQALKTTTSKTTQAGAHAICGLAQIGLNQLETAIESCQTAVKLYKKEDWAYWCLGDAFVVQEKWEAATTQYEQAVQLKPDNALYHNKWAQTLVQLEQYEAAVTQYQKVVELDKDGELGKQAQTEIEALTAKMKERPSEESPKSEDSSPDK